MAIYFKKTFIAIILILPLAVSNFVFAATQSASTGDAGGTCTSWTYSDWSSCSGGQQTRTIVSSSPSGCSAGSPTLSQSCSSGGGGGGGGTIFLNSAKAIIAFIISGQVGVSIIDEKESTISLVMPAGTDVTNLVPIISITGSSISPASRVANNFTIPQIYKVTAADGSTQNYAVTVNIASAYPATTDWFINTVKRTDIIRDGKIDVLDFNALMVNWGKREIGNFADVNQDGIVDVFDFNLVMVYWGQIEIIS